MLLATQDFASDTTTQPTKMHDVFHRFAEQLAASHDVADLREVLVETATSLDLPSFAYLFPSAGRDAGLISTYSGTWTSHYLRNGYEAVDPVVLRALCCRDTFRWDADGLNLDLSAPQRQLMDEASQFGIRCGFTIPIHGRRGLFAAVTFAADERRPLFFNVIERYERTLQLIAMVFHIHVRQCLAADRTVDGVVLSPRETECLGWAARGKSAWDIGAILGISQRTAAFHLDNAKNKLGVRTITQAAIRFAVSRRSDFR